MARIDLDGGGRRETRHLAACRVVLCDDIVDRGEDVREMRPREDYRLHTAEIERPVRANEVERGLGEEPPASSANGLLASAVSERVVTRRLPNGRARLRR